MDKSRELAAWTPAGSVATTAPASDAVINAFVQATALSKQAFVVGNGTSLAHIASQGVPGAPLFLLWSTSVEADRWADVLADEPQVVAIDVSTLIAQTLPAIAAAGGRIGTDWTCEPVEPELSPPDLDQRLRAQLVRDFALGVTKSRVVWVLHDLEDLVGFAAPDGRDEIIPVWADRHTAERSAKAAKSSAAPMRLPVGDLLGRFLLSPRGLRARMAPAYIPGAAAPLFSAWAFKSLLTTGGRTSQVA